MTIPSTEKCLNCDHLLQPSFKYCPNCSQKVAFSYQLKELFTHFLNDYFTFDSKIGRSIIPLLTRPGYLTLQFLAGKRERYIQPLRLFIFLSIIFFLLLSISVSIKDTSVTSSIESSAVTGGFDDAFWDRFFGALLPKLFFVLLPLFALILALLYRRKRLNLITHFLFALHYHSTVFFVGILYELSSLVFATKELYTLNSILLSCTAAYLLFYLLKALMKVYHDNWKKTLLKLSILGFLYLTLLFSFTFILFALSINY